MKKIMFFLQKRTTLKYLILILYTGLVPCYILLDSYRKPEVPEKKDNTLEIKRLSDKADYYYDNYKTDSAIYTFHKVRALCDLDINFEEYVYATTCIAVLEGKQGNFVISENYLTETLPYLNRIKKTRFASNVYDQFANNYYYTYDYENSILYHTKALHLKTSTYRKITMLNSICLGYIGQKKYKLAESILIPLSKIKVILEKDKDINDLEHARILDNLGICYFQQGKPEALFYFKKSLDIKLRLQDYDGLIYSYRHLCEFYHKNNPALAKSYGEKAYQIATKINATPNRIQSLQLLIKNLDGKELKKYTEIYVNLLDSFNIANKKTKNQFSNIKYNAKKDREENSLLKTKKIENELQLERQRNRSFISYVIISFSIIVILLLSIYLTSKGKKEKTDAIYKSEMRISKKLHDELASDVQQTLIFAENNNLEIEINKEKLLNNLDQIYSKTRNISKENSNIKTNEEYILALREMISGYKTQEVNILLNGFDTVRWNQIEKNKKIILYRVLQELFLNMKKHSNASLVSVTVKIKDNIMTVLYIDNGNGIKNNPLILKNGLQNVENRIKTINGTLTFDNNSEKGFKLSFTVPL